MKIIFIAKSIPLREKFERLGIMCISSVLRHSGFKTEFSLPDYKYLRARIKKENGKVILAYSTITVSARYYIDLNKSLKMEFPHVFSIFGGPHPTFFPEMIEEEGVDCICMGEGEYAMLDLVRNLESNRPIYDIKNLWVKENNKIHKNPLRPLIENLDELPFPDNNLFSERTIFMTSRGCPFNCSFCSAPAYDRLYNNDTRKVRERSIDNVITEIKQVKSQFRLNFLTFYDSNLILSKKRLEEFSYKYKKEINLPFFCHARFDLVTEESIQLLKKAGCAIIFLGIESGNDYARNIIFNKGISKEQILRAARLIKKQKIKLMTGNILGAPDTTLEMDLETLFLNIKCRPFIAQATILSSYPGTQLYYDELTNLSNSFKSKILGKQWHLERENKSVQEKRQLENLASLFLLIVKFPVLFLFTKFLISLPLTRLYAKIGFLLERLLINLFVMKKIMSKKIIFKHEDISNQ